MNWDRFKFRGLQQHSIAKSLQQVASRVLLSAPFQIPVYWAVVLRHDRYLHDPVTLSLFAVIVVNILVRILIYSQAKRILAHPQGQVLFRFMFGLIMILIGTAWGATCAYIVHDVGITVESTVAILSMFGTVATMAGFSFDLPLTLLGQIFMLTPLTIVLLRSQGELRIFGFMVAFYSVYICLLSVSFNRVQMQALKTLESLEEQEAKLREAHESLQIQHDLTGAMLDNIDQAFLLFDEKGICSSIASHRSMELLGLEPRGLSIFDVLRIPPEERNQVLSWYQLLFLNRLPFSEIADRGPKQIVLEDGKRTLKLEWHPLFTKEQNLSSVIFTAKDITTEVGASEKFERQRELAGMLLAINQNRLRFGDFLKDFDRYLIEALGGSKLSAATIRYELHNFKASAFMFRAAPVGRMIHETELLLRGDEPSREQVRNAFENLQKRFAIWKNQETPLFAQLGVFDEGMIEVSAQRFRELEQTFANDPNENEIFEKIKDSLTSINVWDRIAIYRSHVLQLAARLGKQVSFVIKKDSESIEIPFALHREVFRSFVHLFNNSVDHGIELPEARAAVGKSADGTIWLSSFKIVRNGRNWLKLLIEDDGGGIRLANKPSVESAANPVSNSLQELSDFIFTEGRSSRSEVSEVSGLGFGMSAVRAAVLKAGGKIELLSTSPKGTRFEIELPI